MIYKNNQNFENEREIPSREDIRQIERRNVMNSYLRLNFTRSFRSSESSYESDKTMDGPKKIDIQKILDVLESDENIDFDEI